MTKILACYSIYNKDIIFDKLKIYILYEIYYKQGGADFFDGGLSLW